MRMSNGFGLIGKFGFQANDAVVAACRPYPRRWDLKRLPDRSATANSAKSLAAEKFTNLQTPALARLHSQ
jgi:hypothetical protein